MELSRLCLTVLGVAAVANAGTTAATEKELAQPLIQELFLGESPYPQERGALQVTSGVSRSRGDGGAQTRLGVELEYGLSDRFELGAEVPWVRSTPHAGSRAHGLGDVAVSALYAFVRSDIAVVSLYAEVQLPSGDEGRGLGEGESVYSTALLASRKVGAATEIYLNLGGEFAGSEHNTTYTGAVVGRLAEGFAGVLEIGGNAGTEDAGYLTPGLYWVRSDDFQLGLALPFGYGAAADDRQVLLRLALELD